MKSKLFLLTALLMTLCSCGYRMGHVMHPQIKTVAIGKITNSTYEPGLDVAMRAKLRERFMFDGSLQLVDLEDADIIVSGDITKFKLSQSGTVTQKEREERLGFNSTIFKSALTFKYEVKTRKKWDVTKATATGEGEFTELLDQFEERRQASKRAAYDAAKKVVYAITEAW